METSPKSGRRSMTINQKDIPITNEPDILYSPKKLIISPYLDKHKNPKVKIYLKQDPPASLKYDGSPPIQNLLQSHGTWHYSNGDKYIGSFLNSQRHGKGIYHYHESHTYQGQYSQNLSHGLGSLSYENGAQFTGHWQNGQANGLGTMVYSNGSIYAGQWLNNERNGQGTFRFDDGSIYTGNYHMDIRQGFGI